MYLVIVHRNPPHGPPKRRCLWSFAFGNLGNLRRNYVNSSWNDYCFRVRNPYLCTECISEVKKSGTLSFKLNLPNLGLAQPVLELYMREREREREIVHRLFSQTFATLDDSRLVPPSSLPSDYFMPSIEMFCNDFYILAGLYPWKP